MPRAINAEKRRETLKRQRHEDLRARIANGMTVAEIIKGEKQAEELLAEAEPNAARISALRLLLDSKYRRLAKVLPDLKAVELTGEGGEELVITVNLVPHGGLGD